MISFVLDNVREEIVVHVSGQLRRRGIVGGVQTKPDRTSHRHIRQLVCNKVVIKYPIVIIAREILVSEKIHVLINNAVLADANDVDGVAVQWIQVRRLQSPRIRRMSYPCRQARPR